MASAAEIRARLLAKRAAQHEETRRKESIHEKAKLATKQLVFLGYNFDDILKMAESGVGEEHLNLLFRAIGIHRKRKTLRANRNNTFGASRWLDKRDEFIINFDEDFSTSESEMDGEKSADLQKSLDNSYEATPGNEAASGAGIDTTEAAEILSNASPELDTLDAAFDSTTTNSCVISEPLVELQWNESPRSPIHNQTSDSMHNAPEEFMDVVTNDAAPKGKTEDEFERGSVAEFTGSGSASLSRTDDAHLANPQEASERQWEGPRVERPPSTTQDFATEDEEMFVHETIGEVDEANELTLQHELERVKAQIAEMQQRKLEREAQRSIEQNLARQNMKLRDIAARRSLLSQQRERINVQKTASRVARLEKRLMAAKDELESIYQQLKGIDSESLELEKQEVLLREELARPKITLVSPEQDAPVLLPAQPIDEITPKEPELKFHALTARDSPLRAFSSFRMCPSLGPLHWFSKSFNGRFIDNLLSRSLCATELSDKKGNCMDASCDDVHFADFDVDPVKICQYMATRQIDRPGFRSQLLEAISTHLDGDEVPADQLAASIIGFCRKYDATQILDWQGWQLERPF